MKLLEFIIILALLAAAAALYVSAQTTIAKLQGQISALQRADGDQASASIKAAGADALSCADRVAKAVTAGATIARVSVVHVRAKPTEQSMMSAQDIRDAAGLVGGAR